MNDELAELLFPLAGIDEARELEEQRPGTTPSGVNVRAFEPATQRARGGARPGLVRYVPARVNGANYIQDLSAVCVTTDPAGMGGVISVTDGFLIDPVPGSVQDPAQPFGGDGSGGFFGFQPVYNYDRPGGDSAAFKKAKKKKMRLVQQAGASDFGGTSAAPLAHAFGSSVTKGNLLVVAVGSAIGAPGWSVADGLGTTYHLVATVGIPAGAVVPAVTMSFWYGFAPASGPCTVTLSRGAVCSGGWTAAEYQGLSAFHAGVSNAVAVAAGTVTTGAIPVTAAKELLVAALMAASADGSSVSNVVTLDAPYAADFGASVGDFTTGAGFGDLLNATSARAITGTQAVGNVGYLAVGASFQP